MSLHPVSRRHFLRGVGTLVALPTMESLLPRPLARAAEQTERFPTRLAFVYSPNGKNMAHWRPEGVGANYSLSRALRPLEAHREDFSVISGLELETANANGDGGGDHARANAAFLTGCQPRKTAGADIRAGVSVDQVAAQKLGHLTRFPSLEISCDEARKAGNCDSGYSCAYQFNLAWKSESMPLTPERDPRSVFDRLFGTGEEAPDPESLARRHAENRSILDYVLADAKDLQRHLGRRDQEKLDEYLTSLRQVERRIGQASDAARLLPPGTKRPDGIPASYQEHIRLMYDLLVLAFQTDSTRIGTFLLAHDGSNRTFPEVGVNDAHHGFSHHQHHPDKLEMLAKVDEFHSSQFAYFLDRLKSIKEDDGSLLDHSMIVFGAGISDPDRHNHNDLPILLAGRGGGTLRPGRHIALPEETPLTNLYLSLLDRIGVPAEKMGDSSGRLEDIA
ncbi:MAG: DUF1552 domain-containing protein [Verrucomicrobiales bacterium]